ncbi:aminoacyl-tRNA hydrolase [Candidatus Sumerlaeota bacterium]|nr:aminoacyl-tRNA hydrolase [Candidatus Sumerlaeota bacterium]
MWLIAGLGNPGSRYDNTPHNLGFEVAAELARRHNLAFSPSKLAQAHVTEGVINGEKIALMMPTTFMNLSGEAINAYRQYYKINPLHTLAISDDVAIPWGRIRVRGNGTHGGHNGLRNIIQHLGTDQFPRIRIGCEPDGWQGTLVAYVLAKLGGEPLELARHMIQIAADAAEMIIEKGVDKTQNKYNGYDAFAGD